MNITKTTLLSLFTCFLMGIASSCTSASVEHWIDNPTDSDIIITINGADHTVAAKSGITHSFEYGRNTLTYDGHTVNFIVKPCKLPVIINPTQSNYILYKNIYVNASDERATEEYLDWLEKQTMSEVELVFNDSLQTISVPFKVTNDLFVEKTNYQWDYSLEEELPVNLSLHTIINRHNRHKLANDENYKAGQFQAVKSKLFRESEFLKYLDDSKAGIKISFPNTKIPLEDLPKVKMAEISLDSVTCEPGRKAIGEVLEHYNNWLTMKGSDFAKEYDNYISITWKVTMPSDLEHKCTDYITEDFSYKQAATRVNEVLHKLYHVNFFIIE